MHGTVICTVVTSNYLHFALALARSVRRIYADLPLVICLADRTEELPDLDDPYTEFVFADQLGIPRWPRLPIAWIRSSTRATPSSRWSRRIILG